MCRCPLSNYLLTLPPSSLCKGPELAGTQKTPFYVLLRLDNFHVAPAPQSGVNPTWWAKHIKMNVNDKLKGVKALLMQLVTEQPSMREDDESVSSSRVAVVGLKNAMEELPVEAEEEE